MAALFCFLFSCLNTPVVSTVLSAMLQSGFLPHTTKGSHSRGFGSHMEQYLGGPLR